MTPGGSKVCNVESTRSTIATGQPRRSAMSSSVDRDIARLVDMIDQVLPDQTVGGILQGDAHLREQVVLERRFRGDEALEVVLIVAAAGATAAATSARSRASGPSPSSSPRAASG